MSGKSKIQQVVTIKARFDIEDGQAVYRFWNQMLQEKGDTQTDPRITDAHRVFDELGEEDRVLQRVKQHYGNQSFLHYLVCPDAFNMLFCCVTKWDVDTAGTALERFNFFYHGGRRSILFRVSDQGHLDLAPATELAPVPLSKTREP